MSEAERSVADNPLCRVSDQMTDRFRGLRSVLADYLVVRNTALALLVALPMSVHAIGLLPELTLRVPNVNDDAEHLLFVQGASDALARGENVVDFWVPEMDEGFPEFLYYQNLPHLAVVALHRALLGTIDLTTVFNLVRYLLLVLFPITVFWSMRGMDFDPVAAAVGAAASSLIAINSWMWLPYFLERGFLTASPYLLQEKYASYGAGTILGWLFTGELTDHGRLPVLAALLAIGVAAAVVTRARSALFALALFAIWLVLYFGRATLGPLAMLLPLQETLLFHRFIGGVHIAAIMLMGVGGAAIFSLLRTRTSLPRTGLAVAAIAIALAPALKDRYTFEETNGIWMRQTQAAIDADAEMRSLVAALRELPAGRVYAGLRSNWGERLDFAIPFRSVHAYQYLVTERFRMLAPPFGGASLNSDLQFDFNDQSEAQYDLYNVRYVIAPRDVSFPSFMRVLQTTARYTLYAAPSSGHAEFVALTGRESVTTQAKLFPRNRAFVNGSGPGERAYLRWNYPAPVDSVVSGPVAGCANGGELHYERIQPSRFDFLTSCPGAATLVIKETFHPNWRATVDGNPAETFMVSPSYVGLSVPPGDHFVTVEYRSTPLKTPLLIVGVVLLIAVVAARRDLPTLVRARVASV